eukprot:m.22068 g.22068  ORF g.22068 m.22068 type:complete len:557 (-) comp3952_c0_seq2:184-1854(-)
MAEGTYTPSPLARLIHQTPRITFHFNAASAVFDPESRNYEEGLASIAIVFLTFGIFLFLLMTYTVCCSGEVGDEAKTVYRPATASAMRRRRTCLQTCSTLVIAGCLGLVLSVFMFELAVQSMESDAEEAANRFDDVGSTGSHLSGLLNTTGELTGELDTSNSTQAQEAQQALMAGCADATTAVQQLMDEHANVAFNMSTATSVVDDVLPYVMYSAGGVAALVAAPAAVMLLGACSRGAAALQAAAVVYVLLLFITVLLSGVAFAASVGLSDFCVDPNGYITTILVKDNAPDATFYLNCTSASPTPFDAYIAQANEALNQSTVALTELESLLPASDTLANISHDLTAVAADVHALENDVACQGFNGNYHAVVAAVCYRGLNAVFSTAALQFLTALSIMATVIGARTLWPMYRTQSASYEALNTQGEQDNVDERTSANPWRDPSYGAVEPGSNGRHFRGGGGGYGGSHHAPRGTDSGSHGRDDDPPPWYRESDPVASSSHRDESPPPPWYEAVISGGRRGASGGGADGEDGNIWATAAASGAGDKGVDAAPVWPNTYE